MNPPEPDPPATVPPAPAKPEEAEGEDGRSRENQASKLVAFAQERAELFHNPNREVFVLTKENRQVLRLAGSAFKDWIMAGFYTATGKAARSQAVGEAVNVLSGLGRENDQSREVHVRVALHDGAYFLDLAEEGNGRAVKIRPGSWEIVDAPPVYFVRSGSMRPLPEPQRRGKIDPLWSIANIPEDARILVLTWVCECLRPDTPFAILELIGEQGSAKSTTQSALRSLVDPNLANLRSLPRNRDDLAVSAVESWLTSLENVSHLSPEFQDDLCKLSTGNGFAKRKHYENAEEIVLLLKRPVVLNGISVAVTAQDLVNRTVSLELPALGGRNVEEPVLLAAFEAERGRVLGAMLDIFADALARLPGVCLPPDLTDTRLISFLKLGVAVAGACGQPAEAFLGPFKERRQEAVSRTLDASPVGTAIQEWFRCNPQGRTDTAGTLFMEIERFRPSNCEAWPRSAKGFADGMRRIAPALRMVGIDCKQAGHTERGNEWGIHSCTR